MRACKRQEHIERMAAAALALKSTALEESVVYIVGQQTLLPISCQAEVLAAAQEARASQAM